ncbi:ABC transporter substrate-binding protein [Streptomyces chumphonensis]|uniref:ABC transporter substrate-binding protein n=1 Tax=Streptomyces chumphonensis TaxID=1214925 RepID=A0A927IEH8_9ACTN|nr:ABC transporter substrate-binding protein [Streptomyces chumphonensis]MBD3934172.1 ABC transporter substrate-binding protein [Streptomyces chumphonensis]
MTGRRIRTTAAAVAAVLLGAAGCSSPSEGGGGSADTSYVVGIATEPETLSPLLGYGKDGNSKIFDGLLSRDADLTLTPALAAELPEASEDGLTYTYTLREDVAFSDGTPFTAADVVFTYETILDEDTNNPARGELDAIESVTAEGDHRVVFRLKYPYAAFPERTVLPIASEAVAGKQDVNTGAYNTEPVGTGPYVLTSWSRGEKLSFRANADYWGGEPEVEKLTMAVIDDDDIRATRLRSGDLDAAVLPPDLARTFADSDGRKIVEATSADFRGVTMPTENEVTGDRAVRRALDIATDRTAMVDNILDGAGRVAHGAVPTVSPWFAEGTERPHDPAEAEEILEQAGWEPGEDGVRVKDGRRAAFTLWYPAGDQVRQEHALAFAGDAKKIGVDITVESGTWEVIEPAMKEDAVLAGGGNPTDPDFDLYTLFHSDLAGDGFHNMARYANPAVDEKLEEGRRSADREVRKAAYDAVQRELRDDPGHIFLTHIDHVYVVSGDWENVTTQVEPHDHGLGAGPWWNIEDWRRGK